MSTKQLYIYCKLGKISVPIHTKYNILQYISIQSIYTVSNLSVTLLKFHYFVVYLFIDNLINVTNNENVLYKKM